jgi:hypothetical protein
MLVYVEDFVSSVIGSVGVVSDGIVKKLATTKKIKVFDHVPPRFLISTG